MILLLFVLLGISAAAVWYFMGNPFGGDEKKDKSQPKAVKKITHKIASKRISKPEKAADTKSVDPAGDPVAATTPGKTEPKGTVSKTVAAKTETKASKAIDKPVKVAFEGDIETLKRKITDLENKLSESEKQCAAAEKKHRETVDSLMAKLEKTEKSPKSKPQQKKTAASVMATKSVSKAKKQKRVKKKAAAGGPYFPTGKKSYQGVPIESYTPPKVYHKEATSTSATSYTPRKSSYQAGTGGQVAPYMPRSKYTGDSTETGSYFGGYAQPRKSSGKTLYDMSIRFGDSNSSSSGTESRYKLAPGVAVYPRKTFGSF